MIKHNCFWHSYFTIQLQDAKCNERLDEDSKDERLLCIPDGEEKILEL